jgi:hypothetical protein
MSFHRSWRQDDFCQWYLPKRYIQIYRYICIEYGTGWY